MLYYFDNSYTGSRVGFQPSCISDQATGLALIRDDTDISPYTKSAMRNGGAKCISGQLEGKSYFVIKDVQTLDADGRVWYINLAIEAAVNERELFRSVVQTILVDNVNFQKELGSWFSVADGSLPYKIDAERFHAFLETVKPVDLQLPYYSRKNYYVGVLKHFLADLREGLTHRIQFLVPERNTEYFFKMNPTFDGLYIAYSMSSEPFRFLLRRDDALFTVSQPVEPWKYCRVPTADRLDRINKEAKVAAAIAATATVLYAARQIGQIFKEG